MLLPYGACHIGFMLHAACCTLVRRTPRATAKAVIVPDLTVAAGLTLCGLAHGLRYRQVIRQLSDDNVALRKSQQSACHSACCALGAHHLRVACVPLASAPAASPITIGRRTR